MVSEKRKIGHRGTESQRKDRSELIRHTDKLVRQGNSILVETREGVIAHGCPQ